MARENDKSLAVYIGNTQWFSTTVSDKDDAISQIELLASAMTDGDYDEDFEATWPSGS